MQSARNWKTITILAVAIGGGIIFVNNAQAGTVTEGETIGGWTLNTSDGVTLNATVSGGTLHIDADVTALSLAGQIITFVQASPTAVSTIDLDTYELTNDSGFAFGEYQGLLVNPYVDPGSLPPVFASPTDVYTNIVPFTTLGYTPSIITFGGGTLADGATTTFSGGGGLVIDANPVADDMKAFSFKGIGSPGAVPLPRAAFAGAAGIGAVIAAQSTRKRRAKRA
jgi:hypothetical protein